MCEIFLKSQDKENELTEVIHSQTKCMLHAFFKQNVYFQANLKKKKKLSHNRKST